MAQDDGVVQRVHAALGDVLDGKIDSDHLAAFVASSAPQLSERQAEVVGQMIETRWGLVCACMRGEHEGETRRVASVGMCFATQFKLHAVNQLAHTHHKPKQQNRLKDDTDAKEQALEALQKRP